MSARGFWSYCKKMHCFKLLISKFPCYVLLWSRYMPVRCEALCWAILTVSHSLITLQEMQFNAVNHRCFPLPLVLSDTCHLCSKFNLSLKHAINFVPGNKWDPRNEVRICINHWLIMLQHMPPSNFDISVCDWEQVALFINEKWEMKGGKGKTYQRESKHYDWNK